jgi:hypothetical protein
MSGRLHMPRFTVLPTTTKGVKKTKERGANPEEARHAWSQDGGTRHVVEPLEGDLEAVVQVRLEHALEDAQVALHALAQQALSTGEVVQSVKSGLRTWARTLGLSRSVKQ